MNTTMKKISVVSVLWLLSQVTVAELTLIEDKKLSDVTAQKV